VWPEDFVDEDVGFNSRSIVIGVVVVGSKWNCNDGGESHGRLDRLMEMAYFQIT
jgi:hypothetical protein